jgi:proline dehydrogenase
MNLMRRMLVKASESRWLRERAPRFGFVRGAAARFMPGEKPEDALAAARSLAENGISSLLTQLGENIAERAEAEGVVAHYLDLLERIRAANLPAEVSVKLTQLGLDLDREFCFANLTTLIESSRAASPAVEKTLWIDMEQSAYVDATLELHARARKATRNIGVCVQAYLHRTEKDVESLVSMGAALRLVKGAYSEPPEIAFPEKEDVDENYFRLAQMLLSPEARRAGVRAVMATHDRKLIARITEWAAAQGIAKNRLEFAMLFGIQRAEQLRLAQEGYISGVLISYGSFWFPWFMRRLAERPANVLFLVRNLFSS